MSPQEQKLLTQSNDIIQDPRIYTEEEIDLFLKGDRREIDKLLLISLNSMVRTFLTFRNTEFRPHAEEEIVMKDALGAPEDVLRRRIWLDQQIQKEMDRARLRRKIIEATFLKVLPTLIIGAFILFATGLKDKMIEWIGLNTLISRPHDQSPTKDGKK